jgi:hypothetical protein
VRAVLSSLPYREDAMRMRYFVAGSLLVVAMIAMVQAQPGGGRGGFGGPLFLVNNKAVQEDIKATEDQVEKLREFQKDFFPKIGEIYKERGIEFGFGKGKGFSEEDRAKMAEANAEVAKMAYKEIGDILKKEQVDRLKQIERQQMGVNAFTNDEVVTALKLTDSQKASVKGISGDFDRERREIFAEAFKDAPGGKGGKGGKGGFGRGLDPEVMKRVNKVQSESVGKIVDLLDDSQKKTWKELVGAEFDLAKLQGGFGGFGGKDGKRKKKDD